MKNKYMIDFGYATGKLDIVFDNDLQREEWLTKNSHYYVLCPTTELDILDKYLIPIFITNIPSSYPASKVKFSDYVELQGLLMEQDTIRHLHWPPVDITEKYIRERLNFNFCINTDWECLGLRSIVHHYCIEEYVTAIPLRRLSEAVKKYGPDMIRRILE